MTTKEQAIRERADVLSYEARQYPRATHMAHMWLITAREWAESHGSLALRMHLDLRISALSEHRRERLLSGTA